MSHPPAKITAKTYTAIVEFWIPVWRNFTVEAANPQAACEAALAVAQNSQHDTWRDGVEEATTYRIAHLATGKHHNAQDAEQCDVIAVPSPHTAPTTMLIQGAPELVRAARAMLDAFGGNAPDWIAAEWEALALALNRAAPVEG